MALSGMIGWAFSFAATGLSRDTVVHRVKRGAHKTALKVGSTYVIDANEPHIVLRIKFGKHIKPKAED